MESHQLVIKETKGLLECCYCEFRPKSATQSLEKAPFTKDQLELLYKMMGHVGNSTNSSSLFA